MRVEHESAWQKEWAWKTNPIEFGQKTSSTVFFFCFYFVCFFCNFELGNNMMWKHFIIEKANESDRMKCNRKRKKAGRKNEKKNEKAFNRWLFVFEQKEGDIRSAWSSVGAFIGSSWLVGLRRRPSVRLIMRRRPIVSMTIFNNQIFLFLLKWILIKTNKPNLFVHILLFAFFKKLSFFVCKSSKSIV